MEYSLFRASDELTINRNQRHLFMAAAFGIDQRIRDRLLYGSFSMLIGPSIFVLTLT
jgi:hypothetical protein